MPKSEQIIIETFEKSLSYNPFLGKPLGLVFFREKKLNSRRVYFLVYEQSAAVLMVAVSDKKAQQVTIDAIKENLEAYSESITKILWKT